jgi:hypothetical protein
MSLIDLTYFRGEITLANISSPPIAERVNAFIAKYEPDLLDKVLGYKMAEEFILGLSQPIVEERWSKLKDGSIFQIGLEMYKWKGFVNASKTSIIANYVYYHFSVDNVHHTVGAGNLAPIVENGTIDSPAPKLTKTWNEMVIMTGGLIKFLEANIADYPDWRPLGCARNKNPFDYVNSFNL